MTQRRRYRLAAVLFAWITLAAASSGAADPVQTFIVEADSLAQAGGDQALAAFISHHEALVGAVVSQLLDVAFQVGEAGDTAAEAENVDFAERLARLFRSEGSSGVPSELVRTYRGWNAAQRGIRAKAKSLHDQADALRTSEPEKAVELYQQAMALYEQIGDAHSIAVVWGGLGVAYWYLGDLETVKTQYEKALAARRAVEDRILEGRTLNGLGSVHLRTGDLPGAADYYRRAIELRRETGDLEGLGTSITYLGHVYFEQGKMVDARDLYEEALPVLEAQGKAGAMVDVLNGVANCYSEMGRYERANQTYRRAIRAARVAGETQKENECRFNLTSDYRLTGRYAEALAELDTTAASLERHPDTRTEARFYRERGVTYMDAGRLDRAREDVLKSVELADSLGDPTFQTQCLVNVGYLYEKLGAFDRGLEVAQRAKAMAEENGLARMYRESVALIAELYRFKGDLAKALENWQEVLAQDEYDQSTWSVLVDRITIAGIHAALGNVQRARVELYDVTPQVRAAKSDMVETGMLLTLGHTFEKENPDSAAHYYEAALSVIERSRASLGADETRSGFLSGERRFYFEEVARYYASLFATAGGDWADRAFVTVERAKARGLLDLLLLAESSRMSSGEEEVLDALYRLDPDQPDYATQRSRLRSDYERLREERMKQSVGSLMENETLVDLREVRKALPKHTTMLQYALGDTTSLLWVIDRGGFELLKLPNRAALRPAVEQLRDAVAQPGAGDAALRRSSRLLYEMLVSPAESRLAGARQLIIVPDGFLHEVPFDALLTADPDAEAGWEAQPYLARNYATVYAPSATIYLRLSERKQPHYRLELAAFGDPDYELLQGDGDLTALPYARAEVGAISRNVESKRREVRLGADANEAAVKRRLADGPTRVVHFATHGLVNPVEPSASSVVLCPDPAGKEDGYLHTLEILSIPSRTGVVVVSACGSALGRVSRGEGVVGLSRAFIAGGAGSVVASLWAVSDESTSELMSAFYAEMLGKKRPAAAAMHEARLELIKSGRYAHPFYWSPFVVIGTDRSPW
jgi:CHAT domain-containing protein/Tfp pilus assembly protein PilF